MISKLKKIRINNFPLKSLKGVKFFIFASLRVLYLGIKEFIRNKGPQIASSLTYYTLISVVPILALSFGIAEKLGIEDFLEKGLVEHFNEQQVIINWILRFTHNMLQTAQSGLVSGIGVSILFLSAIQLLSNMELFFGTLWRIEDKRKVRNKVIIYTALILLVPIFLIVSGIFKVIVIQKFQFFIEKWPTFEYLSFLISFLPYLLVWVLFTLIYLLLPKVRVKFLVALTAGVLTGSIYEITQWGYIYFQIGVLNYSAVYSSFAALPLFLIWLQLSWMILLFGAQICSIMSNIYRSEFEKVSKKTSMRYRLILSIWIVHSILKSNEPVTQKNLYEKLNIPFALSHLLLKRLLRSGVLLKKSGRKAASYKIDFDPDTFKVKALIDKLNWCGVNDLKFIRSAKLSEINDIIKSLENEIEFSSSNLLMKNLTI